MFGLHLVKSGVFTPSVVLFGHVRDFECEPINRQAAVWFITSENVILPITGRNVCLFVMAGLCGFMGIRSIMSI